MQIRGQSMYPTFKDQDEVKVIPIDNTSPLLRGLVVVFCKHANCLDSDYQVKRIIGLPTETIIFRKGRVWIKNSDGQEFELDESGYLLANNISFKLAISNYPYFPSPNSNQPQPGDDYFEQPLTDNQYYVLGDNRTSSLDSRSYGAIEREWVRYRIV